jgi:hypothetical protein
MKLKPQLAALAIGLLGSLIMGLDLNIAAWVSPEASVLVTLLRQTKQLGLSPAVAVIMWAGPGIGGFVAAISLGLIQRGQGPR